MATSSVWRRVGWPRTTSAVALSVAFKNDSGMSSPHRSGAGSVSAKADSAATRWPSARRRDTASRVAFAAMAISSTGSVAS